MPVTNQFERDVVNQAQLKHPGRVDLIVLQNTADAGDGSPGIQRCFRNYLHQGGMENDIDLLAHGIIGTSVNISNVELQQLSNIGAAVISSNEWLQIANIGTADISANEWSQLANIGAVTGIDATQWGYVGEMDQDVSQSQNPSFTGLTLTGNLTIAGNSIIGTGVNITNAELQQVATIGAVTINVTQWGYLGSSNQAIATTDTPSFAGLALTGNLTIAGNSITGTSVNINNAEMQQLSNIGANTISSAQWGYITLMNQSVRNNATVSFGAINCNGTLAMGANVITTSSTVDGVDVGSHTHTGAGNNGPVILHSSTSGRTTDSHHAQSHTLQSHTGDLIYTQLDSIVDTSGTGSSTKISRANHVHTAGVGSTQVRDRKSVV